MIRFTEDGEEYWFDADEAETNYKGDNPSIVSTLENIESVASDVKQSDVESDEIVIGPTEYNYSPEKAREIVSSLLKSREGVSIIEEKSGPQVIDRSRIVTDVDLLLKRVYVDDPSEVPAGVTLHEGERGGLYYDDDSGDFAQMQIDTDADRMANYDFSNEQIEEGVQVLSRIEGRANDIFAEWFDFAMDAGEPTGATHRTKSVGSALEKVYDRKDDNYDSVSDLDDLHGSKIKFDTIEECTEMFEAIQESDEINVIEAEDKYGSDGPYRAHHIIAEFGGDTVELQIKQEDLSDIASASHALVFKPKTAPTDEMETLDEPADEQMQEEINECLSEMSDYIEGIDDTISCSDESFNVIEEYFQLMFE